MENDDTGRRWILGLGSVCTLTGMHIHSHINAYTTYRHTQRELEE